MERLRASREKFLSNFRWARAEVETANDGENPVPRTSLTDSSKVAIATSVQEVMMEEWENVRMQYENLPQIPQTKRSKVAAADSSYPGHRKTDDWKVSEAMAEGCWLKIWSYVVYHSSGLT